VGCVGCGGGGGVVVWGWYGGCGGMGGGGVGVRGVGVGGWFPLAFEHSKVCTLSSATLDTYNFFKLNF
jgi:hypothetical protein